MSCFVWNCELLYNFNETPWFTRYGSESNNTTKNSGCATCGKWYRSSGGPWPFEFCGVEALWRAVGYSALQGIWRNYNVDDILCRLLWPCGLTPLDCWHSGFESSWGHGYSIVFVLCYVGSGLCDELITRSECACVCDLETSTMRRPRPELDCCATKSEKGRCFVQYDHYCFCYWNIYIILTD